ncbi:hypothetical protein [Melittangium boletus]|uniref:Lipoprotein n=1 Tax=Melittangium boletus DSM 14713 TaxID=1294270 RepID=A0A250IE98_9BACT|nr:hypothetical protein [Melittangium boletus]ATB29563.1 hypothetical protein MEBOL_003018 [Melittangium boletus DSM 14713]
MTKTKLLLAGLLTGAVAFGAGCKTDTASRSGTQQSTPPAPDTGTGGTGFDTPQSMPPSDTTPIEGDTGTREREPDVHRAPPLDEPGTGGSGTLPDSDGLEPDGLGQDNLDAPVVPDSNDAPINDGMMNNGTSVPQK